MTEYRRTRIPGLVDSYADLSANYSDVVLSDGPVALWGCQEASGSLADATGNGHAGTKVGAGTITYEVAGPGTGILAIEHDGTTATGFDVADNDAWSSTYQSWEAWLWLSSASWSEVYRIAMGKVGSGASNPEWWLGALNSGSQWFARIGNTAQAGWLDITAGSFTDEQWYHVVATRESADGYLRLYVNDSLVGTDTSTSGTREPNGSAALGLGYRPGLAGYSWEGRMSMLAFYDYGLTSTQVSAHYAAMPA